MKYGVIIHIGDYTMKKIILAVGIILSFCVSGLVQAAVPPYTTTQLTSLAHGSFYTWRIDLTDIKDEINLNDVSITDATITFYDISRSYDTSNLYVQLLDGTPSSGVTVYGDWDNYGNTFNDIPVGKQLVKYTNADIPGYYSPSLPKLEYSFSSTNLSDLKGYILNDGIIGLGFDPDCHFWDSKVTFSITTASSGNANSVPEPATMLLFGTGLIGLAGVKMRRKKN